MENKKVNITQQQLKSYPAPEIPVEQGWSKMNEMLDADMPAGNNDKDSGIGRKRYLLLLLLLFTGSIGYYGYYQSGKTAKLAGSKTNEQQQSLHLNNNNNNTNNNTSLKEEPSVNTSSLVTTEPKNNSPVPLVNITDDKGAVANTKEKQQKPAAASLVAAHLKNTGSSKKISSGMANQAATLADHANSLDINSTASTGDKQEKQTVEGKEKAGDAGVAVSLSPQPVTADNKLNEKEKTETPVSNENNNTIKDRNAANTVTINDNTKPASETLLVKEKENNTVETINTATAATNNQTTELKAAQQQVSQNKLQAKKTSTFIKKSGVNYGLQWNVSIPLQGMKNYFSGTNGSSQFYIALIPDLWISKELGKRQELMFTLHLSNLYATGDRKLNATTGRLSLIDTTTVIKSTSLLKTSGFTMGLQYNYNMNRRWSIGAGINYHLVNRALVNEKITGYYTGAVVSEFTEVASKGGSSWSYLNASFFTGKLELAYYFGRIKAGTALYMPLTNMASVPGTNIKPLNGQLFLRWNLKK